MDYKQFSLLDDVVVYNNSENNSIAKICVVLILLLQQQQTTNKQQTTNNIHTHTHTHTNVLNRFALLIKQHVGLLFANLIGCCWCDFRVIEFIPFVIVFAK
jgi:hypothetical protein